MEGEGLMLYTAVSHKGREKFFFFVFWWNFWLQSGSCHMTFGFFHYVTAGEQTHPGCGS